jgi:hypothetical protein
MNRSIAIFVAAVLGILFAGDALAGPARCSDEKTKCLAVCKISSPGISPCVTNCNMRQTMCVRTGCWDSGTNRYCGLARQ